MEVQELQVLRIVFTFSHQRCSLEGKHSCLFIHFILCSQQLVLVSYQKKLYSHSFLVSYFVRSGSWTGGEGAWVELSGKMHVLARLLAHLRQRTDDRIVLVSNYTQVRRHLAN